MIIDFLFQNFDVISLSCLFAIVLTSICIFFIQNKFIKKTEIKLDKYNDLINRNSLDLAEYIKTLSKIIESNKNNLDNLTDKISNLEKDILRIAEIKGNDDLLTLAINLARSGSSKDEIKEKTGLNDEEINTIYAYHKKILE